MLAQSAIHEAPLASSAADMLSGANGSSRKGKKAKGLVGLFSDMLAQAQKGKKGSEGIKAEAGKALEQGTNPRLKGKTGEAQKKSGSYLLADGSRLSARAPSAAQAAPASAQAVRAAAPNAASKSNAKAEVKTEGEADEAKAAEAKLRLNDKKKLRQKGEADEDAAASVASMAGLKAGQTNAVLSKSPKATGSDDIDSSINTDGKKAEKSSSKPEVTVVDLRRANDAKKGQSAKSAASAEEGLAVDATKEAKVSSKDQGNQLVRELSLDVRASGETGGASSSAKADSSVGAARGQDFQSLLAERMRDAWNGEIVQSAHIVLKDGDVGTIRLRLRPESLGNVKIELNLSDNNISGRITVESDAAKSAFEKNMNELSDAFKQGGFDSAKLEVAVGGGSSNGAQARSGGDSSPGPFFSERLRSAVGSQSDPATAVSAYRQRGSAVDILA
jgi:flagellar hook-length control protein FliK